MAYGIEDISGIDPAEREKLREIGIRTTGELLYACRESSGRERIAQKIGVPTETVLRWTCHADLMRISGIGRQFAELLEAAGVANVDSLRAQQAPALADRLMEINADNRFARTSPGATVVESWISQARFVQAMVIRD